VTLLETLQARAAARPKLDRKSLLHSKAASRESEILPAAPSEIDGEHY
jgi:hypothetical protein